jgi:hypothetical protein
MAIHAKKRNIKMKKGGGGVNGWMDECLHHLLLGRLSWPVFQAGARQNICWIPAEGRPHVRPATSFTCVSQIFFKPACKWRASQCFRHVDVDPCHAGLLVHILNPKSQPVLSIFGMQSCLFKPQNLKPYPVMLFHGVQGCLFKFNGIPGADFSC